MSYGITDLAKNLVGIRPDAATLRKDEFWALQNINFALKKGDVLGLIGVNGSGKTTLLRLLTGIFPPDEGEIIIRGKVGALIALGTGFHPYFTGRENIYLNGAILGLGRDELDAQFDEIIQFSEIGDFIDAPVATYSSGMRVRLGFAVAMAMKPDLLLIDEVLAVGDLGFKIKCLNKINEIMERAAVIFVSHSMQLVARVSNKIMVLHKGCINHQGDDIAAGIDHYVSQFSLPEQRIAGTGKASVSEVRIGNHHQGATGDTTLCFNYGDDLRLEMVLCIQPSVKKPAMTIYIQNQELYPVAECFSEQCGFSIATTPEKSIVKITFRNLQFNAGIYTIGIAVLDRAARDEIVLRQDAVASFQMAYSIRSWSSTILSGEWEQQA
jgi:lipopolysaccharide transport system ATP-binding protein